MKKITIKPIVTSKRKIESDTIERINPAFAKPLLRLTFAALLFEIIANIREITPNIN